MKHAFLGLSLLAMMAAAPSVKAADFGSTKDTYAQYSPFNWNGTQFGVNVGGANMSSEVNQQFPSFSVFGINEGTVLDAIGADRSIRGDNSDEGVVGGFQMGLLRQYGQIVLGGEIGLNGSDLKSSGRCWKAARGFDLTGGPASDYNLNANVECSTALDWTIDAAAKIGYAYDRWLPYLSIGYALAGTTHTNAFSYKDRIGVDGANTLSNNANFTHTTNEVMHGITWGAGLDYAVTDSLIIGGEFKRYDLSADGGGILGTSDRDLSANIFRIRGSIKTN